MDRAAVADFFGLIGDDAKEQLLDPERHVKIALALIDPLEIVDHPLEDLTVQRAPEELGPERHPAAVRLLQERTALLFGQDLAAVERVDEDVGHRLPAGVTHQEVSREGNPGEAAADPAADFQVDRGQRDRDPDPAVEDVVQERVAGVVVLLPVAAEPHLLEQQAVQMRDLAGGALASLHASPDLARHLVQAGEVPSHVQVGIFFARDQERGVTQIDRVVRQRQQGREGPAGVSGVLHRRSFHHLYYPRPSLG